MSNNGFSKVYNEFLKEEVKRYCDKEGFYEIYWDSLDEIYPSDLQEAYENYKKYGFENIASYIQNTLLEDMNEDCEVALANSIEEDLKICDFYTPEFEEWYKDNCSLYDDLEINGYRGIDLNLNELLAKSKFNFNIMFATKEELNSDMTKISNSFTGNDVGEYSSSKFDNSLTYLIHQQGHSVMEVFKEYLGSPKGYSMSYKTNFVESVVDEIANNPDTMSELTCLVELNGLDAINFLEYLDNEENNKTLVFSKDTMIGLFNEWNGSGSLLEINLDKDFVVPKSMIKSFQIERGDNQTYTVDEVYGLTRDCWKPNALSYTDEEQKIAFETENIDEAINFAKDYFKKQEESFKKAEEEEEL